MKLAIIIAACSVLLFSACADQSQTNKGAEVLVSNTVREWIHRDFDVDPENVAVERPQPKKWEEPIILHTLSGLKPNAVADSKMPADFVYTLGKIKKRERSVAAVVAIAERFQVGAGVASPVAPSL